MEKIEKYWKKNEQAHVKVSGKIYGQTHNDRGRQTDYPVYSLDNHVIFR